MWAGPRRQTAHIWSVMTLERPTFRPTEKVGLQSGPVHIVAGAAHICVSAQAVYIWSGPVPGGHVTEIYINSTFVIVSIGW